MFPGYFKNMPPKSPVNAVALSYALGFMILFALKVHHIPARAEGPGIEILNVDKP